jgi:hypothetical protein
VRVSLDGEDDGEVEDGRESFTWLDMRMRNAILTLCHPPDSANIRFGEQHKISRGDERQRRRVSAPI